MADFEGNMLFPDTAAAQATIAANKRWQSKLITTSGTFTVPADVGAIWIDGCGSGGGGGGGNSTPGGGGGGGSAAMAVCGLGPFPVSPGETLTIVIPAGGAGGAIGADGSAGNAATVTGSLRALNIRAGLYGRKGENPNGGAGGPFLNGSGWLVAATGDGANSIEFKPFASHNLYQGKGAVSEGVSTGSGGGALGYAGGYSYSLSDFYGNNYLISTGNASGGGGGSGGCGPFGLGGRGGSNGAAIVTQASGYGSGGAGGSGNNPGGPGTQGFICIYCFSATTI